MQQHKEARLRGCEQTHTLKAILAHAFVAVVQRSNFFLKHRKRKLETKQTLWGKQNPGTREAGELRIWLDGRSWDSETPGPAQHKEVCKVSPFPGAQD